VYPSSQMYSNLYLAILFRFVLWLAMVLSESQRHVSSRRLNRQGKNAA